ncbi:MAG: hypothetical protein ACOVMQ_01365 [Cyclobacteriaceae bacterium]|jgi:hypothetical protein
MIRLFNHYLCYFLLVINLMACSQFREKENQALNEAQTFTKKEYDEMRTYFSADTLIQSKLVRAINKNDSDAIQLQLLLATEYEHRSESGISDGEIKAIILSYRAMITVKHKFDKIDSALTQMHASNAQEVRLMTDSVLEKMKQLQRELKEIN